MILWCLIRIYCEQLFLLDKYVGIKNDFSAQLHKFLANLTDTRWKLEGKTVLYIPTEGLKLASEEAAKNKDLVQRLESKHLSVCYLCIMTRGWILA